MICQYCWKGLNISYLYLPDLLCLFCFFFLCSALGYKYVYPQLLERFHLPNDADTEELVERGLAQTSELLEVIENFYLQDHPFLCGSELTVADSYVATIMCQAELVELDFILWPRLCAWMVKVKGQEHWVEVHSAHGNFLQKVKKVNVTWSSSVRKRGKCEQIVWATLRISTAMSNTLISLFKVKNLT